MGRKGGPLRGCNFRSLEGQQWASTWMLESPAGEEAALAAPRAQPGGKHESYMCSPAPIWGPAGKGRDRDLNARWDTGGLSCVRDSADGKWAQAPR